jgi:hypothetical protein
MNFRNCKHYSEVTNVFRQVWSHCSCKDVPGYRCKLYKTGGYSEKCSYFESTFKYMMEEAIIEAENRP